MKNKSGIENIIVNGKLLTYDDSLIYMAGYNKGHRDASELWYKITKELLKQSEEKQNGENG